MQPPAPPVVPEWPKPWQQKGFNYCMESAADALRYLSCQERPSGGSQAYNAEHLLQIASELHKTQLEFLAPAVAGMEAQARELAAWRIRFAGLQFEEGSGIVPKGPTPTA